MQIADQHQHKQHINKQQSHQILDQYFDKGLKVKNGLLYRDRALQAINQVDSINNRMNQFIEQGYLQVSQKSKSCENLMQQKITKEQQKAIVLRKKREQLQIQLNYINREMESVSNLHSQKSQSVTNKMLTKQEHQKLVKKVVKQRVKSEIKRKKYQQEIEKKIKEEELQYKKAEQIIIKNEKQDRKKKIEAKLKEQQEMHDKKVSQEAALNKKLQEVKNKKCLYQKIQEHYNSHVLIPQLQQKKKKLKQIREISRGFNTEQLKLHEKQYLKKREASALNKSKVQQTWNYRPPEKAERLAKMLEDEQNIIKEKLLERKKNIEDRIRKQQTFIEHLKEKYIPKIDQAKRLQIENRNKKQMKKEPLGYKIAGMNYLEESKKAAKTPSQRINTNKNIQQSDSEQQRVEIQKKSATNYLVSSKNREQYQQIRRKRLDKILNSESTDPRDKIKQLQIQSDKIGEKAKRKQYLGKQTKNESVQQEAIDLLLTSIKAKMGIIDIYKNKS